MAGETLKWKAADLSEALKARSQNREAVRKQYDVALKTLGNQYRDNLTALNVQYQAAGTDTQKRAEIQSQINAEHQRYAQAENQLKSERSEAIDRASDLGQYRNNMTRDKYDAKAQQDKDRMSSAISSLGGYFDKKNQGAEPDKKEEKPDNPNLPNLISGSPSAIENDPYRLKGTNQPVARGNPFMGNVQLTDEQKKEQADNEKAEKNRNAKEAQERTGGTGLDTRSVNYGEDENGSPTFADYHPAYAAIQKMDKPERGEKNPGDWEDYRTAFGLGKYLRDRLHAGDKDPMNRSGHLRRQAEMHDIEAGDHQRSMQQNLQVANRDYRSEAEKNAASQAAAENAQKVHNLGNAGAGAAALERDVKAADYNTTMQRSDEQRKQGVENMEKMHDMRQTAEQERSGADVYDYTARDMNDYNARSDWLSMGGPQSDRRQPYPREKERIPDETVTPEAPKPDNNDRLLDANPQMVINKYLGARQADGDMEQEEPLDENEQALFDYMTENYPNVKPVPSSQSVREPYYKRLGVDVSRTNPDPNKWAKATAAWSKTDDEYGKASDKQKVLEVLDNWRGGNKIEGQAEKQTSDEGYSVENTGGENWQGKRR